MVWDFFPHLPESGCALMSIKLRLNLALALVLALAIASMTAALLLDSGPRLRNEIESSMRVTESLVRDSVASLADSAHPGESLAEFVHSLRNQRHVRVTLAALMPKTGNVVAADRPHATGDPDAGSEGDLSAIRIPVEVHGRSLGTVLITPDGSDEMSEIRETIWRIASYGFLFALGAFLVTTFLISSSLAPINELQSAMHLLEEGDYDVALPQKGPPEMAAICGRLNTLASALRRSRDENRRLSTSIVRIQDEERRDVARELHDELGPHLFSLRASGSALVNLIEKGEPDLPRIRRDVLGMMERADALQQTNRRVLQRLAPAGLKELGLKRAIEALVATWAKEQPHIDIDLAVTGHIDGLDETTTLTIYRVVQEGLTNAFRHAWAHRISIAIESDTTAAGESSGQVRIRIRDDGHGLPEEKADGFGLRGMRERVGALGGSLTITSLERGGTQLDAHVPLAKT